MSGSPGGETAEPNLTPILDMVFQLITFFMLVLNFKAAELDLNLQLPVITSAKPLPEGGSKLKLLTLNVELATKCPREGCDGLCTLRRVRDEDRRVTGCELVCEHGHPPTPVPKNYAITHGKTCLSVYGRLIGKESHGKDAPSINEYLKSEAEMSLLAANLTRDDVVHGAKELPDIVVIRADTNCRFGAVNYIVNQCQEQGYRKFALKTAHKEN